MQNEMVIVNDKWLAACGRSALAGVPLRVIGERYFSAYNAHYVTVRLPAGMEWEVNVSRGVKVVHYVA